MKLAIALAAVVCSAAAQGLTDVPPILQLIRKPGIDAGGTLRPYYGVKAAVDVIGMTAITGLPETWNIELHQTFAEIEDLDRALASTIVPDNPLAPTRTMILIYQPGWSYRPQDAVRRLARSRYFHVSVYTMQTGADADLGELMKLRRHEMDTVNLDRPDLVYRVVSGAPSGTYIILAPLLSLKTMDDGIGKLPVYAEPLATAEAAAGKNAASRELGREHFLFRVEPSRSYVSQDFSAADPQFWRH